MNALVFWVFWCYAFSSIDAVIKLPGQEDNPTVYNVELYIICDNYCYNNVMQTNSDVAQFVRNLVAQSNAIMAQINVQLIMTGLEIWNGYGWTNWTSPIVNYNVLYSWAMNKRLELQSTKGYFDDLILLTGLPFFAGTGASAGGVHSPSTIGNSNSVGVISVGQYPNLNQIRTVLSHELGHGLNMAHDDQVSGGCYCPLSPGNCIMNSIYTPTMYSNPIFSNCSKTSFYQWIQGPNSRSLNKVIASTAAQTVRPANALCGNGVVDPGEQCDCGPNCSPTGCCQCCTNCMLVSGAQCATGSCCNNSNCQFKKASVKCRTSRDPTCDYDDFCPGNDSKCPDNYASSTTDCLDSFSTAGYCKNGFCNTPNAQCQAIWSTDYRSGIDACFNSTNLPKNARSSLPGSYKCQTLICSSANSTSTLPYDRRYQTFPVSRSNNQKCLIGSYLPVETGLLGMSGIVQVENGTKCGDGMACYKGACIDVVNATQQMQNSAFTRKVAYCGNGRLDSGEDCDCGPTFTAANSPCLSSCGLCSGTSSSCGPILQSNASNFKQCRGSFDRLCYGSNCVDLGSICTTHYYPWAQYPPFEYMSNVGQSSQNYNSGGFYIKQASTNTVIYSEYRPGQDDGKCGVVQCIPNGGSDPSNFPDFDSTPYPSETFPVRYVNSGWLKVRYYMKYSQSVNGDTYKYFYPLLVDDGTPCRLANNVLGYCRTYQADSTGKPGQKYPFSQCTAI